MSDVLIRIEGLRVERDGIILDGIDWEVRRGEHWAILGPNGSGKSSLLAAVCGYLVPTAGRVQLLGERYGQFEWQKLKSRVGLVSSVVANLIEPGESAAEVVLSGRFGMVNFWGKASRADREAAAEALERVQAADVADRPWRQLSQGERQRALIGRALMSGCEILMLDEPCAGLDPAARERFLTFLGDFGERPDAPSMTLVTHHIEEVMPCFTHALALEKGGRAAASGPVAETLRTEPLSRAFGEPVTVRRKGKRFRLELP